MPQPRRQHLGPFWGTFWDSKLVLFLQVLGSFFDNFVDAFLIILGPQGAAFFLRALRARGEFFLISRKSSREYSVVLGQGDVPISGSFWEACSLFLWGGGLFFFWARFARREFSFLKKIKAPAAPNIGIRQASPPLFSFFLKKGCSGPSHPWAISLGLGS